jgi:hypothetical protein
MEVEMGNDSWFNDWTVKQRQRGIWTDETRASVGAARAIGLIPKFLNLSPSWRAEVLIHSTSLKFEADHGSWERQSRHQDTIISQSR